MSNRLGGVLNIIAGGLALSVRGTCTLRHGLPTRTGVVGQTGGVHGYTEEPMVPGVDVEVTSNADFSLTTLHGQDDMTVQIDLKDGRSFVLQNAWYRAEGGGETDLITAGMTLNFDGKKLEPV